MDHANRPHDPHHPRLPTTEAAVAALREVAREFDLEIEVTHDIGADQTSRRSHAGVGVTADPDGSLPHEAYVELGGTPRIDVRLFPEDDALIKVEGVEFHDVPRDEVPAFLRSCYGGLAHVRGKRFPPGYRLVVPLPGDRTYKEFLPMIGLTGWLSSRVR
ncbi:hypothetical protein [Streptomyces sp. VRA16 Mangrove soil]|uniref:hypothetical protein n=1 Tax=Streptomyces sp. VRA16 Mangrove soil TaxID=2817434 RepID=UPI001A9D9BD0|nr:hypothetical protein [Streptomyces sp. VRA16 Mangrove soil]MBO1336735.1 hypothetical protein [Streptomyces sp. VRA16 Mangrove soil]